MDEIEAETVTRVMKTLGNNVGLCSSCNGRIWWATTAKGKRMPLNSDGTSHFATCANAAQHRKPKGTL